MACERSLTASKNVRAAVLFTAIWAVCMIVKAAEGHQQERTVNLGKENMDRGSHLKEGRIHETGNSTVKVAERFISVDLFLKPFKMIVTTVVSALAKPYVYEDQGNHTCYRDVCFTLENGLGLEVGGPKSPEEENTTFIFYSREDRSGKDVNETTWKDFFDSFPGNISKPLVAIVHGLNGSRESPWINTLITALLDNVDCNVLRVDWQERARFPYYAKAASSTPLVGILLSFMLQTIIETSNCSLHPNDVHVVGFSLGAHAAGVCGRHFYNTTDMLLGRITGLDPAGPLFESSNVSLSKNDAQFVDVMHTNAGKFDEGKLGLDKSIGHVDFYPNGGSDQPGCSITKDPACSHKRAQGFFIESVHRNCSFISYYCADGWPAYLSGKCTEVKNESYIGDMGFYSLNALGRGNQYLKTRAEPPYCLNHTELWRKLEEAESKAKLSKKDGTEHTLAVNSVNEPK